MSTPLLDSDLREMMVLRWQLCEAEVNLDDLPYSAAWGRALLLHQLLTEFHDETAAGRVAGLQGPGELDGLEALRAAARAHVDAMAANMLEGS